MNLRKMTLVTLITMSTASVYFAQSIQDSARVKQIEGVVITGVIDVVKERETPVAASVISTREIVEKAGNQEFPEILKATPSIYTTKQGGGYGDSRINVRGFSQRNTAVIINGQPVNDMENGKVYWSNWSGLTDIASAVEVQRGLGASRLAVPSVGGTINVVTKATSKKRGGFFRATLGNDHYAKLVAGYNTGINNKGWASSFLLGRWQGDGYVDGTQGEGYSYFASVGYKPSRKHLFNLTFTGAGQWHNQRDQWLTIEDFQNYGKHSDDFRKFNADWGYKNGEVYSFRRNFYNKPITSLNWDWEISDRLSIGTVIYASWGRGGGTGPRGKNYGIYPYKKSLTESIASGSLPYRTSEGLIDFDAIVNNNRSQVYTGSNNYFNGKYVGSNGYTEDGINKNIAIRRASMNSHNWYGGISNLKYEINNWTLGAGIDLRSYKGYHYRVLNDLLGLDAYYSTGNKNLESGIFVTQAIKASPFHNTGIDGTKIDYFNVVNVGWQGFNGVIEYKDKVNQKYSAVLQGGVSNQSYKKSDYFDQSPANTVSDTANNLGGYVKGGINYNLDRKHNVFVNAGYISRQPNADAVFPNYGTKVNQEAKNEKITSIELGYGFHTRGFDLNLNLYRTLWSNRWASSGLTVDVPDPANPGSFVQEFGTANYRNIAEVHQGIELDMKARPMSSLTLKGMVSIGDWRYTNNITATVFDDSQNNLGESTLYLNDVKVGDAAQFTASLGAEVQIAKGLKLDASYLHIDNLYANFSANDKEFTFADNKGAVKLPSYGLVDAGISYEYKFRNRNKLGFRFNMNNVLDTEYISESKTNIHADSSSTLYNGIDVKNSVWFGFGRTWNFNVSYSF